MADDRVTIELSREDSRRVREILASESRTYSDQMWDHVPTLLTVTMLVQVFGVVLLGMVGSGLAMVLAFVMTLEDAGVEELAAAVAARGGRVPAVGVPWTGPPPPDGACAGPGVPWTRPAVAWGPLQDPAVGVRVSSRQGPVAWPVLAESGVPFVWVRATDGADGLDTCAADHWAGAGAAGLARAPVHVFRPDVDAAAQAEHFLRFVRDDPGEVAPVLDLLTAARSGADLSGAAADVVAWVTAVEAGIGRRPVVYGDQAVFVGQLGGLDPLPEVALALHEPSRGPAVRPEGFPVWTAWAFTDDGQVDGIQGAVTFVRAAAAP